MADTAGCVIGVRRQVRQHMPGLTDGVVPAVDSKQAAAGDRNDSGHAQVRQRIGSHVRHRRVGGKFQHHDHVLLHLILKHEWTLRKETLMKRKIARKTETDTAREEEENRRRWEGKANEGRMKEKEGERCVRVEPSGLQEELQGGMKSTGVMQRMRDKVCFRSQENRAWLFKSKQHSQPKGSIRKQVGRVFNLMLSRETHCITAIFWKL